MFCITSFLFFSIKDDLKKTKAFLVFLSILVSYSRIYLGVHYPGNVLLADIIGIICGFITSRLYFYVKYDILPF
jgi:undecaprenyl-diphosphatase